MPKIGGKQKTAGYREGITFLYICYCFLCVFCGQFHPKWHGKELGRNGKELADLGQFCQFPPRKREGMGRNWEGIDRTVSAKKARRSGLFVFDGLSTLDLAGCLNCTPGRFCECRSCRHFLDLIAIRWRDKPNTPIRREFHDGEMAIKMIASQCHQFLPDADIFLCHFLTPEYICR